MKTRLVATAVMVVMVCVGAAACGDDDGGGGGGAAQQRVAEQTIELLTSEDGIEVDEGCIEDVAGSLSDSDAQAILESYETGEDPDVSDAGMAASDRLVDCVSFDSGE